MPFPCAAGCGHEIADADDEDDYFPCDECKRVFCGGCFATHLVTDDSGLLEHSICYDCQARL